MMTPQKPAVVVIKKTAEVLAPAMAIVPISLTGYGSRQGQGGAPAVVDWIVYFGSENSHLYAADIQTGQEKWRFNTGDRVDSTPAIADGVANFRSLDRDLYAVNVDTGRDLGLSFEGAR